MIFLKPVIAIMLCSFLFTSCIEDARCPNGNNDIESKKLAVPTFEGIEFAIPGDVVVTQGDVQEVTLVGDRNVINSIENDVIAGIWEIDFGKKCFDHYDLTVNITTPNIKAIYLSGSGSITLNDFTDQGNLALTISGSGDIQVDQFSGCEELSINISGSGKIKTQGDFSDLKKLDIIISGSGNYFGYPISTDECAVTISGSGSCEVDVREKLDVLISGSGSVYYHGNPDLTVNLSGSGQVINAN